MIITSIVCLRVQELSPDMTAHLMETYQSEVHHNYIY